MWELSSIFKPGRTVQLAFVVSTFHAPPLAEAATPALAQASM